MRLFKKKKKYTIIRYGEFEEIRLEEFSVIHTKKGITSDGRLRLEMYDKLKITVELLREQD